MSKSYEVAKEFSLLDALQAHTLFSFVPPDITRSYWQTDPNTPSYIYRFGYPDFVNPRNLINVDVIDNSMTRTDMYTFFSSDPRSAILLGQTPTGANGSNIKIMEQFKVMIGSNLAPTRYYWDISEPSSGPNGSQTPPISCVTLLYEPGSCFGLTKGHTRVIFNLKNRDSSPTVIVLEHNALFVNGQALEFKEKCPYPSLSFAVDTIETVFGIPNVLQQPVERVAAVLRSRIEASLRAPVS